MSCFSSPFASEIVCWKMLRWYAKRSFLEYPNESSIITKPQPWVKRELELNRCFFSRTTTINIYVLFTRRDRITNREIDISLRLYRHYWNFISLHPTAKLLPLLSIESERKTRKVLHRHHANNADGKDHYMSERTSS